MYWTNALIMVLLFAFVVVCALLCLVVLMQRSKQEGLGAAFGGGFTESVWGAQTSQVLVKATVVLAASFFVLSIFLARLYSYRTGLEKEKSPVQQELLQPVAPAKIPPGSSAVPGIGKPVPAAQAVVPTAAPMIPATPAAKTTNGAPVAPAK